MKPWQEKIMSSLLWTTFVLITCWGLCGWITPTPFCQLYLRPTVLPHPLSAWLSLSLLTREAPKPDMFPIYFYPCLHPIWKLEAWLLLMQTVNGHETPPPQGKEKPYFPSSVDMLFPSNQVLFLTLALLSPPVLFPTPSGVSIAADSSGLLSARSNLYASYTQETS